MQTLTKVEREVLEVFWDSSRALCVTDVLLINPNLNKNTVRVIVRQLTNKKLLEVTHIGKNKKALTQFFSPTISKEDFVQQDLSEQNLQHLVANFIEGSETEEELDKLELLIAKKRKSLKRK
ncbi:BlaI/MecI/CopY family transcriptional regulator [Enterococcus olivae]